MGVQWGLVSLIARVPWRETVTYQDTWPHEYVPIERDDQREDAGRFPPSRE